MGDRAGTVVLLATLPLVSVVVDPLGWFPFGPSKWLVVSTLVPAGAALALWHRPGGSPSAASRLAWALVAWLGVAALVGADGVYAWTGTPERHLGVFAWGLCALALFAGQRIDVARDRAVLTWSLVAAGLGAGLFATAEALGWEPAVFAVTAGRLTATMGSAAYLGALTALLLPAAVGVALDDRLGRLLRRAAAVAAALLTIACVGSGARAAWVGLTVAAIAVTFARRESIFRDRRFVDRRNIAMGVAGVIVAAVALLVWSPAGDRVASATDRDNGGGSSRVDEWRVATHVLSHHLVTGVGPEGYRIAFAEGVDDAYEQHYGRDPLPDRAHSSVLDVALAGGLPALVLWSAVVGLILRAALRAMRTDARWLAGIAAGVVAYLAGELLLFPIAELEPSVWLLGGMLMAATSRPPRASGVRRRALGVLLGALALVCLVAGLFDVAADHKAEDAVNARIAADAVRAARAAVDRRPDEVRLHLLLAQALLADDRGTNAALAAINDAARVSPRDPIVLLQRARVLVQRAASTHLPVDVQAARDDVEALLHHDPANGALWLLAGQAAQLDGDQPAADAAFAQAERLGQRPR